MAPSDALELAQALFDAATHCETAPDGRAVVLTGAGRMFCAGHGDGGSGGHGAGG